jgi:CheY-like chemotaxis protein
MEALPPNVSPPLQAFAIFFTEMFKQAGTNVAVSDHTVVADEASHSLEFVAPHTASSLRSTKAPGRGSTKSTASKRVARRKPRTRDLQLSVLVVDDVPDVTEMIALFLKHAGYDVATADSATMALQLAGRKAFDLIISDIGMPEMNGYEFAESLRTLTDYRSTPIIAVTGYSEYDDRARALQAGFNAHLTKPIDPSRLLDLMNQLLA